MATTCSGVLPGQKTASGTPWRSERCRSTRAKRRSSTGRSRSRRERPAPASTRPARHVLEERSYFFPIHLQDLVGAAAAEALEIHGHVEIAELAEARHDRLAAPVLPEPRRSPRAAARSAPAGRGGGRGTGGSRGSCTNASAASICRSFSGGDPVAVLKARGQAREGRLVPGRQPELARERRGSPPSTARPRSSARARPSPWPPPCPGRWSPRSSMLAP